MPKKELRSKKQELKVSPEKKKTSAKRRAKQTPTSTKKNVNKILNSQLSTFTSYLSTLNSTFSRRTKILFASGAFLLLISLGWHLNQTIQLMFFTPKVEQKNLPTGRHNPTIPTKIKIPKVNIDLPIEQTAIRNNIWQISDKGASYLAVSGRPGEKENIIMYGHNTLERFGPIRWLTEGDMIELKTKNGKIHKYKVTETMTVAPTRMDILTQKRGETLILYTCDGFADLERFVLIATPAR